MLYFVFFGCADDEWRMMPELVGLMYNSVSSLVMFSQVSTLTKVQSIQEWDTVSTATFVHGERKVGVTTVQKCQKII